MEEDLTPEDEKEHEELEFDTNNPLFVFCFMFMEYIKTKDPDLYSKAHDYAQDHTDLDITDFEIIDFDEEEIEDEDEDEFYEDEESDIDYEDNEYGQED